MPTGLFVQNGLDANGIQEKMEYLAMRPFVEAIYSIYWQIKDNPVYGYDSEEGKWVEVSTKKSFYLKWYSHLNYTRAEYQKIAMQLWYWRKRIVELI